MPKSNEGRYVERRAGLSVARLSWMLGITPHQYREIVEGETWPSYDVWERIAKFSGWPRAFVEDSPCNRLDRQHKSGA